MPLVEVPWPNTQRTVVRFPALPRAEFGRLTWRGIIGWWSGGSRGGWWRTQQGLSEIARCTAHRSHGRGDAAWRRRVILRIADWGAVGQGVFGVSRNGKLDSWGIIGYQIGEKFFYKLNEKSIALLLKFHK